MIILALLLTFVGAQKCKESCMQSCLDVTPGIDCYPRCCDFNPEIYAVVPLYKLSPDGQLIQIENPLKYPDCDQTCFTVCLEAGANQYKCNYNCKCNPLDLVPTIHESRLAQYSIPLVTNITTLEQGTTLLEATLKEKATTKCEKKCATACIGQAEDCEIDCLAEQCVDKTKISTMMIIGFAGCGFVLTLLSKKFIPRREDFNHYTRLE
ncbi:unnamed protein product [Blepharisma stoltei]|uniref:Uncharacterized protein n=1 Tax=Blepharisma stoltei TaxID=1481888 RepID=A0AAU9KAL0_9CILI|nr:unnamed protein product [Blepharisma stoltei]